MFPDKLYKFRFSILILALIPSLIFARAKLIDFFDSTEHSYDFLNSFAGYRSETYDMNIEEKNEKSNKKRPKVKIAEAL